MEFRIKYTLKNGDSVSLDMWTEAALLENSRRSQGHESNSNLSNTQQIIVSCKRLNNLSVVTECSFSALSNGELRVQNLYAEGQNNSDIIIAASDKGRENYKDLERLYSNLTEIL